MRKLFANKVKKVPLFEGRRRFQVYIDLSLKYCEYHHLLPNVWLNSECYWRYTRIRCYTYTYTSNRSHWSNSESYHHNSDDQTPDGINKLGRSASKYGSIALGRAKWHSKQSRIYRFKSGLWSVRIGLWEFISVVLRYHCVIMSYAGVYESGKRDKAVNSDNHGGIMEE